MPGTSFDADFDAQDQAEVFDESMTVGGEGDASPRGDSPVTPGEDARTFEEMPDVLDMMQKVGDRDEDEALALDADEFTDDAYDENDVEEDDELAYGAVDEDREDELDGLGPEDGYDDDRLDMRREIEGLDEEVRDAGEVSGGEDDFTNFQARNVSDEDLIRMGYSEQHDGRVVAKPDEE